MSLCKGFTQGGSNADIVLADSYVKNITQDVDWATGYEAVVSDAEGMLGKYPLYHYPADNKQMNQQIGQSKVVAV